MIPAFCIECTQAAISLRITLRIYPLSKSNKELFNIELSSIFSLVGRVMFFSSIARSSGVTLMKSFINPLVYAVLILSLLSISFSNFLYSILEMMLSSLYELTMSSSTSLDVLSL